MGKQSNKQMELKQADESSNKINSIDLDVSLETKVIIIKHNIFNFSKTFTIFITNKDETERDVRDVWEERDQI